MSGFHEVRFPENIAYGATGGPEFATTVVATRAGHEKRNVNWAEARGRWDVASGLKKQAQIDELIAFFRARRGKAYGFRFKDWTDYKATGQLLGTGDDALTQFQLVADFPTPCAGASARWSHAGLMVQRSRRGVISQAAASGLWCRKGPTCSPCSSLSLHGTIDGRWRRERLAFGGSWTDAGNHWVALVARSPEQRAP